jgi:WD40 repeat protein
MHCIFNFQNSVYFKTIITRWQFKTKESMTTRRASQRNKLNPQFVEPEAKVLHLKVEQGAPQPQQENNEVETSQTSLKRKLGAISDYERERLENIKRNNEFLSSLGLSSVKSSLVPIVPVAKAPVKRKTPAVKKAPVVAIPTRRSGRVTFEKVQEELSKLKEEGASVEVIAAKQAELDEMKAKRTIGDYTTLYVDNTNQQDDEWNRLTEEPIPFVNFYNKNGDVDLDVASKGIKEVAQALLQPTTSVQAQQSPQGKSSAQQSVAVRKTPIRSANNKNSDDCFKGVQEPVADSYAHALSDESYVAMLDDLTISNEEVMKLTENRITSVFIHPTTHKTLVFAGDKRGFLGVWDVEKTNPEESAPELNGVYKYCPHSATICRIHASPFAPTTVYSTSYDGSVRCFDVAKEQFVRAFQAPEDEYRFYFTDACWMNSAPSCMLVSTSKGNVSMVDVRMSDSTYSWRGDCERGDKLNSVDQHPTMPNLIVTSEKNAICIYDIRKSCASGSSGSSSSSSSTSNTKLKPVHTLEGHTHSINAAYISPDGEYLVSVGHDDTVRTWHNFTNPSVAFDCIVTRHDNNTGRWLSTFRPTFDPKQPHTFILGSMLQPRRIELFSVKPAHPSSSASPTATKQKGAVAGASRSGTGTSSSFEVDLISNLSHESLNSVCSRNAFHPTLNIIGGGNSSGRVHIFRPTNAKSEKK